MLSQLKPDARVFNKAPFTQDANVQLHPGAKCQLEIWPSWWCWGHKQEGGGVDARKGLIKPEPRSA